MTTVTNLPVSQIIPGNNDRKDFDRARLEELAASIQAHGLAQPITVRPLAADLLGQKTFQIIAGERRYRAISQILKWETAPCLVREMSDEEASAVMLAENTGRQDLNPIEEANAYYERIERFSWSVEQVAEVAGVSVDLVKRRLTLRNLADDIRGLVATGQLPIGHAEAMVRLDLNRQRIALRIYRESKNGLSREAFSGIVGQLLEEQSQDSLFDLESFWVSQVQAGAELPKSGKRAVTGAPIRNDVPLIEAGGKDTVGGIFDRYIADLKAAGLTAEAGAVGTLYDLLVKTNFVRVPNAARLLADPELNHPETY
jgi:ParB/RepB/Spo0J family partition protein